MMKGKPMPRAAARSEKIDLRVSSHAKQLLQSAAEAAGARSVSDFVLTSALARAEETLPDRRRFGLNAEQWRAFQEALDAPPRVTPRLFRLMREPSLFEQPADQ
jgi:uncharacterized protein (DUF1778 family)